MNKRRAVLLVLITLSTLFVWAQPSPADHAYGPSFHFRTRDVVLYERSGNAVIRAELQGIADKWNASGANFRFRVQFGPADNACGYTTDGRVEICTYTQTGSRSKGGAANWSRYSDGHIKSATAMMCSSPEPGCFGISTSTVRRILTHEVGHTPGLGEQNSIPPGDTCSVMAQTYCYSEAPNQHDYASLRTLYGHSDGAAATTAPPTTSGPTTTRPPTTSTTRPPTTSTTRPCFLLCFR